MAACSSVTARIEGGKWNLASEHCWTNTRNHDRDLPPILFWIGTTQTTTFGDSGFQGLWLCCCQQVLPDVGFLGAVLVAVERGSAWHQALQLLEQAARCHQGRFLLINFGGSRERTEMCFGFSIRLVVAFVLSLYCIISIVSFLIFLDAFTNSRCVYPGFFDHSWTWLQRQAALGARCCSLWHSGFGFGVLTEQLGPLGQSASPASWWKSPVEVVVICGVFCGEDEWHIVTLKERHRVLQCMNSIDQGIESWKFGLWEKVKQLDTKCRYKVLRDVHLLDRLKILMRKKIHSSVNSMYILPYASPGGHFFTGSFISFPWISPFPWIRESHFRGQFGSRSEVLNGEWAQSSWSR